jgi:hypothetical protein
MTSTLNPPAWAQALLNSLLPDATQESVSGDLLEQYRESALSSRARADRWYVKQLLGFLWRLCALFVVLRVAAVLGRDVVDAFWPPQFWAVAHAYQARSAFTTYAAILTYLLAGMTGAFRSGRVQTGIVAAVATHVLTYAITVSCELPFYFAVIRPDATRLNIFEVTGGWGEQLGLDFVVLPVVVAIAALGGLAGMYARTLLRPRVAG